MSEWDTSFCWMLTCFVQESDTTLYKSALEAIKDSIKTSTSSMTAVPKPLKFLRPHYEPMIKLHEQWPEGDDRTSLADVLSVIGMTFSDEDRQDTLKYRLLAPTSDIGSWGHGFKPRWRHRFHINLGDHHVWKLRFLL